MLSEKLLKALNEQVNFEFYSSYTYLAMAGSCESIDLSGFAHAMKLYDYVYQKNGSIELEQVNKPQIEYDGIIDVFQKGYEHEQLVTKKIYLLTDIAYEEREHSTISLLKWFIDEQVEEENNFNALLKKVRRVGDNQAALYLLDDELQKRQYVPSQTV